MPVIKTKNKFQKICVLKLFVYFCCADLKLLFIINHLRMEIAVFTSKKGTKVVTAMDLHQALELSNHHYGVNIRRWLKDVYQFQDGIRRPVVMKDYALRKQKDASVLEDYYLSVELAKLIALQSKSKVKLKLARYLKEIEASEGSQVPLDQEEVLNMIELVKAMSMRSCQEAAEQQHLALYANRNGNSTSNWWYFRSSLLGYSAEDLRARLENKGINSKGKNQRQMLLHLDPLETIRAAIIDHFMALGRTASFARAMGDLAKNLAKKLGLELFDDRLAGNMFAPEINKALVQQVKSMQRERA